MLTHNALAVKFDVPLTPEQQACSVSIDQGLKTFWSLVEYLQRPPMNNNPSIKWRRPSFVDSWLLDAGCLSRSLPSPVQGMLVQPDSRRGVGHGIRAGTSSVGSASQASLPVDLRRDQHRVGAVGTAGELQDRGPVDQAVEKRRGQGRITEVISPGLEVDVGRQRGRPTARTGIEQPIVDGAGLSLGFTLQAVEAELVDQQEVQPRINSQLAMECAIGQCCREFLEQLGAGRVADMVPQHACGMTDGLENPALAQVRSDRQG